MDNELFELCKEVYKRTEWQGVGVWGTLPHDFGKDSQARIYTSDYLLEKLPTRKILREISGKRWSAEYLGGYVEERTKHIIDKSCSVVADTPLKALLKLTIELHRQGLLEK